MSYLALKNHGHTFDGKTIDDSSNDCFCRMFYDDSTGHFTPQIKVDEFSNDLYNPFNPPERVKLGFKKVKQICFDNYLKFLETNNLARLREAERNR